MATLCAWLQTTGAAGQFFFSFSRGHFGLWLVLCGSLITLAATPTLLAAEASAISAALEAITTDDVQTHVNALADDALEGREAGSRGGRAAGAYLGQQFQQLRLRGGAKGSYYQPFGGSSRNILGVIEGSDPELKNEYVLVTAHYDHVGYGTRSNSNGPIGYIHNGADDNASGVSGLLETADAFNRLPSPPKRSVMFGLWDGEEAGLLGSKHWVENPTVPLNQVAAVINVDMIGRLRNNRVIVYGGRTSYGWRQRIARENESLGLTLDFDWLMKADSDHHPFFAAGVPVVMYHTGLHDDYHRPSDDANKVDADGLRSVAQLMFRTALALADEDTRPKFRNAARNESPGTQPMAERLPPAVPGRLGLAWDAAKAKDSMVLVTSVTAGGAAVKAGIRSGDKIVSYAGRPVTDAEEFRRFVMATRGSVPVEVERAGAEEPLQFRVQPSGGPTTIGLSWRVDDAEPGAVFVVRVAPGSPADAAGLRLYDRIYEVGGRRFASSDEFRTLVNELPSPVELLVETRGKLRRTTLDRLEIVEDGSTGPVAVSTSAAR